MYRLSEPNTLSHCWKLLPRHLRPCVPVSGPCQPRVLRSQDPRHPRCHQAQADRTCQKWEKHPQGKVFIVISFFLRKEHLLCSSSKLELSKSINSFQGHFCSFHIPLNLFVINQDLLWCVCRFLNDLGLAGFEGSWRFDHILFTHAPNLFLEMSKWFWGSQGYFPKNPYSPPWQNSKLQSQWDRNHFAADLIKGIFPTTTVFNGNRAIFMHFHLRLLIWNSLALCQYHKNRMRSSTWLLA